MRRRWTCEHCGRTLRARLEVVVCFHDCRDQWTKAIDERRRIAIEARARGVRPKRIVAIGAPTIDEMRAEAWTDDLPQLKAFAAAVPDDALLRRVEP